MKPLQAAGQKGMILVSGDGATQRGFPVLAAYVGDYPEQVLVALVKTGECPICSIPHAGMGDMDHCSTYPPRDIRPIHGALHSIDSGTQAFTNACVNAGIKPVQNPFWQNLPYVNIYDSITPDILHQLYQGLIKHVITWIKCACGPAEIDARCHHLPPNHNVHLFLKGISHLSRITGAEHDQICRFLLGLVLDIQLPNGVDNQCLIRTVRSTLDFLYLAKYPIHTTETLGMLGSALIKFQENWSIFLDLGVWEHFNIPKLHYLSHYLHFLHCFGTTDNFNTEYTEWLHIDMAKDAYRATNSKDEYPQMTTWLDLCECIMLHEKFIQHYSLQESKPASLAILPSLVYHQQHHIAKHPAHQGVLIGRIIEEYGAEQFEGALCRFVAQYQNPALTVAQVQQAAYNISIPFQKLPVYHHLKFISCDPFQLNPIPQVVDSLHVEPGQFDTAVVDFSGVRNLVGTKGMLCSSWPQSRLIDYAIVNLTIRTLHCPHSVHIWAP